MRREVEKPRAWEKLREPARIMRKPGMKIRIQSTWRAKKMKYP